MDRVPNYKEWLLVRLPRPLAVAVITLVDMPVLIVLVARELWRDESVRIILIFSGGGLLLVSGVMLLGAAIMLFSLHGTANSLFAAIGVLLAAVYFAVLYRTNRKHLPKREKKL
jgi:carbon starvation protein CstA